MMLRWTAASGIGIPSPGDYLVVNHYLVEKPREENCMSAPLSRDPHSAPSGPTYTTAFSAETRKELRQEDTQAWTAIVTLLLGIISMGVVLAVICVVLSSARV